MESNEQIIEKFQQKLDTHFNSFRRLKIDGNYFEIMPSIKDVPTIYSVKYKEKEDILSILYAENTDGLTYNKMGENLIFLKDNVGQIKGIEILGLKDMLKKVQPSISKIKKQQEVKQYEVARLKILSTQDKESRTWDFLKDIIKADFLKGAVHDLQLI